LPSMNDSLEGSPKGLAKPRGEMGSEEKRGAKPR
jgi:hypothetical protein